VQYQILLLGTDASLTTDVIKNPAGEAMTTSYQWTFQTGDLNLATPPTQSLLIENTLAQAINPADIKILPRRTSGVDLTQVIDIIFPGPIDPNSFSLSDLLLSIEPVLGDPRIAVPPNLQPSAEIIGNRIRITITGWPAGSQKYREYPVPGLFATKSFHCRIAVANRRYWQIWRWFTAVAWLAGTGHPGCGWPLWSA
jgi:hypothetical protein